MVTGGGKTTWGLRIIGGMIALLLLWPGPASARDEYITLASTTSTQASGLFEFILPRFQRTTGIEVRVVAVGTGRALEIARRGDADVLLVHHTPSEIEFVEQGYGVARHDVMYNDFVIVGPADDPASLRGMTNAVAAFEKIAAREVFFASRGDDSGTHKKEMALWRQAGIDPVKASGTWYRETGSGMGATLMVATGLQAYTLSDRGSWLNFVDRAKMDLLVEGDDRLFNQYGVILVDPERHPHVKASNGRIFIDWLLSGPGQSAIAAYRIRGQQAFFPNAVDEGAK